MKAKILSFLAGALLTLLVVTALYFLLKGLYGLGQLSCYMDVLQNLDQSRQTSP